MQQESLATQVAQMRAAARTLPVGIAPAAAGVLLRLYTATMQLM